MGVYVPHFGGYVADVPIMRYKPEGGAFITFDKLTSAAQNNTANSLPISGGQSKFPLAIIDTDRTQEFTFECADFSQKLFSTMNNVAIEKASAQKKAKVLEGGRYAVLSGLTVKLPEKAIPASISIDGFEYTSATLATTKFTATSVPVAGEVPAHVLVTFFEGDIAVGDEIDIVYEIESETAEVVPFMTEGTSGRGEMWLKYPVYAGAEEGSGIIADLYYHVFKVHVTALPGLNNSYKTASTFGATFSTIDPLRADGKMSELILVRRATT